MHVSGAKVKSRNAELGIQHENDYLQKKQTAQSTSYTDCEKQVVIYGKQ